MRGEGMAGRRAGGRGAARLGKWGAQEVHVHRCWMIAKPLCRLTRLCNGGLVGGPRLQGDPEHAALLLGLARHQLLALHKRGQCRPGSALQGS